MQAYLPQSYLLQDRYLISRKIGQGGFGITYEAIDQELEKKVCIKELFIDGINQRVGDSVTLIETKKEFSWTYFIANFKSEARKIAGFRHLNIVLVSSVFEANGTAYYVMEYVEGDNIKEKVNKLHRPFTEEEIKPIAYQICDAADAVHSKGLLHRDIKPDNFIITEDNLIVLIDFGSSRENMDDKTVALLAQTTIVMLTHGYSAPELYSDLSTKGRYTDVYSLGATLYFLLSLNKPMTANDRKYARIPALHEVNPLISSQLSSIIMKAMEMEEASRYQSISEMRAELDKIYGNPPLPYPTPIPTPTPKKNLKIELLYKLNKYSAVLKENNFTQKLFYEFDTTKKYKFEPGGTLLILEGSKIERGRWQKISDKDLLLNEGSGEFNYNLIFKDNNLLCINKSGTKTNLLLVHDSMKDNIGDYIKSIYTHFNKAAHGTLSGGEKILVYDAEGKGWDEMIGCKVSIDYQDPKDGDYYNSDNSRVYVIKDGTFAAVRFLKNITTNSGMAITIETRREGSVSHNDLVYTKEGAVPDGTYRWGIFTFIKVKNSKVDDWFGMI